MATWNRCPYHRHSSNMALSSGHLMRSIISPRAGKGAPDCWKTKVSSLPCTRTYYTCHYAPWAQHHIWTVLVVRALARFSRCDSFTWCVLGLCVENNFSVLVGHLWIAKKNKAPLLTPNVTSYGFDRQTKTKKPTEQLKSLDSFLICTLLFTFPTVLAHGLPNKEGPIYGYVTHHVTTLHF